MARHDAGARIQGGCGDDAIRHLEPVGLAYDRCQAGHLGIQRDHRVGVDKLLDALGFLISQVGKGK
jgi:hypothetical protein